MHFSYFSHRFITSVHNEMQIIKLTLSIKSLNEINTFNKISTAVQRFVSLGIMGAQLKASLKPLDYCDAMLLRGLRRAFNFEPL